MKNLKAFSIGAFMLLALASCANKEIKEAEQAVNDFATYVDSITQEKSELIAENWSTIEEDILTKKIEAEIALQSLENKIDLSDKLNATSKKYDDFKSNFYIEIKKIEARKAKLALRSSLFNGREIGDELDFSWVNKDNILTTYENFVTTASENKEKYSREEWDEIKMLYEALDTRKNTVEKEGLSSSDNLKIAGLKVRFATFFKLNRATAKSNENAEAKL